MEIIVELLQFVLECGLQILVEVLFSQGTRVARKSHKPMEPPASALTVLGYVLLGVVAGVLSVWIFPHHFVHAEWLRIANVVITPVLAGMLMGAIGTWRSRRDQEIIGLERFTCGYVFALALAVVRFVFAV